MGSVRVALAAGRRLATTPAASAAAATATSTSGFAGLTS